MADGSAGGGATVVLGLVEDLVRDHEVHVLVEAGSYVAERARLLGATVHEGRFFQSRFDAAATRLVTELVASIKPDLIHLHGGRALFFARGVRHPAITYTVHGYHFLHRGWVDRTFGRLAELASLRSVREIVFVCEYDRELGRKSRMFSPGLATRVIYNGVAIPPPSSFPRVEKQISYLNRLVYQKDPLLAVEVIRALAPEGYRLIMIGGGGMEAEVRAAGAGLDKALDIRGELSREEAMRITAESSVMLMTSRWEGLPLAPLEAMAMGTPVVAPAVSGIPEIVDSGVNGMLVSSRDPVDFANAIRDACRESTALTKAAREKVERVFSWDVCLAGYRKLYTDML